METTGNPENVVGPTISELLDHVWNWALEDRRPATTGCGMFPIYSEDPLVQFHQRLDEYLAEVRADTNSWRIAPKKYSSGSTILGVANSDKLAFLRAIAIRILFHKRMQRHAQDNPGRLRDQVSMLKRIPLLASIARYTGGQRLMDPTSFGTLASELFRTEHPFTEADLASFVDISTEEYINPYFFEYFSPDSVLRALERWTTRNEIPSSLRQKLQGWQLKLSDGTRVSNKSRKLIIRINAMLGLGNDPGIQAGEAWSDASLAGLKQMPGERMVQWCRLLQHCQTAEPSKPTQKWTATANKLVEAVGRDEFKRLVVPWFDLVALPRTVQQESWNEHQPDPNQLIADVNSAILKGLVWICAGWEDKNISRSLSLLAQVCFKKVRNLGPRCPRIGNACLYSLSITLTEAAAGELTRLNQIIKQPSAKKLVGKSLDKAAELSGQTREDLEESTVPTYGLDADGCIKQEFGEYTAQFRIHGPDAFELTWRKADGKTQKSVPAEVKISHGPDLKALKRTLKDIEQMLPAQRQRIERLFLAAREWDFEKWRNRYLNHPLLANICQRLIWHFQQDQQTASGIWYKGNLVDYRGLPLDGPGAKTKVRLWHPLGQEVDAVVGWRRWLEMNEVTQPFKQAHREIYILTDAELKTGTYSNRFAAHIIRQHQFAALAKERGWIYRLQGAFDSHNVPTLVLRQWDIAVEFWVNSPEGHEDTSQAGIYLHLATDQVRFCDMRATARQLTEVPALVFSETMRDVDLFVGVCSVGNDPEWHDRGEEGVYGGYWQRISFGDLSAPAKTRREVLERLLPRLKIAGQCTLQERFLVVRGTLRTYKIHLGSANILMEPNDHYLCIVPDQSRAAARAGQNVFLPFEGDNTLAVILSKAFLLAEDSKIKDHSILHQIQTH